MKPHPNKKQWNIIFLIYAELADKANQEANDAVDVRKALNDLKKTVRNISLKDNFNVFIIENVVELKTNGPASTDFSIKSDNTYIKQLVFDSTANKNHQKNIGYSKKEDFAQTAPDIAGAFKHIDQKYPADKNILITWDHGSAFGIFKKMLPGAPAAPVVPPSASPVAMQAAIALPRLNENITFPVNSGNFKILSQRDAGNQTITMLSTNLYAMLTAPAISFEDFRPGMVQPSRSADFAILSNDNLAYAISKGFSNKYVDVLMMFNCDMQNLHTCYSLRDAANYLVAPQGEIAAPGYDYIAITDLIGQNNAADARDIAALAVNTFQQNFIKRKFPFEMFAIFAVCLKDYKNKMIKPLNDFAIKLEGMMKSNWPLRRHLIGTRIQSYDLSRFYSMIDLINYMQDASEKTKNNELINFFKTALRDAHDSVFIASAVGNSVFSGLPSAESINHRITTGLGLYFPVNAPGSADTDASDFLPGSPFSSSLLTDTKWMEFLNKLYKAETPPTGTE